MLIGKGEIPLVDLLNDNSIEGKAKMDGVGDFESFDVEVIIKLNKELIFLRNFKNKKKEKIIL